MLPSAFMLYLHEEKQHSDTKALRRKQKTFHSERWGRNMYNFIHHSEIHALCRTVQAIEVTNIHQQGGWSKHAITLTVPKADIGHRTLQQGFYFLYYGEEGIKAATSCQRLYI